MFQHASQPESPGSGHRAAPAACRAARAHGRCTAAHPVGRQQLYVRERPAQDHHAAGGIVEGRSTARGRGHDRGCVSGAGQRRPRAVGTRGTRMDGRDRAGSGRGTLPERRQPSGPAGIVHRRVCFLRSAVRQVAGGAAGARRDPGGGASRTAGGTQSPRAGEVMRTLAFSALVFAACSTPHAAARVAASPGGTPRVGPPHGSVIVVGGGALGPEVYAKFIALAGGPDAVIIDVPTAGGDSVYPTDWRGANGLKAAGAKHVVVLHTINRKIADSEGFIAPLKGAGGVWFEGGRHYHLVDSYLGTKTEAAFHKILARGGVMAGSSAGASILGSYLVRGAPSNDNGIMSYPGYEMGFGFLRGVGIDQHVVARERLADLADSVMPRHPEILGISEDEGTAWVVQGDSAEIIGRDKAFVYGGKDPTDPGKPFLTLHPGDSYNLAARRVTHRAITESSLTQQFVDSVFADFAKPGSPAATVLVAQAGRVFIDAAYGIPPQRRYMPETTIPNFPLLGLSAGFNASAVSGIEHDGKLKFEDPFGDGSGLTIRDVLLLHEQSAANWRQLVAPIAQKGGG